MKRIFRMVVVLMGLVGLIHPLAVAVAAEQGQADAAAPAVAAPAPPAPVVKETVWLDDALPPNAKTEGVWEWDTATVSSGTKSHGHPSGKGLQSHSFTADPVTLSASGMLVQQVWLDPKDPPKGIMLKFKLANAQEVGVYWEGEQEVFNPGENEEVWYYGLLPELGKWTSLEVLAEDLGLEEEKIVGLSFITFDGRVLWDKTVITAAPPLTDVEFFPEVPPLPGAADQKKPEEPPAPKKN